MRAGRALVSGLCALALCAGARRARADDAAPVDTAPDRQPQWLQFHAGRVDIDADNRELELSRGVAVRLDRYRLTGDHLKLYRGPRGVVVEGAGRVAFCPCPDPPVTIGFSSVTVAPPSDMLIDQPTLRLGGVPVMWLPWLWLRSPDRLGVLPPRLSWRGKDGLLAGSGVHVPIGSRASALDVRASGYLLGGAEIESRVSTPATSTLLRWDHLRQSLLAVDARGAIHARSGAVAAWSVDAVRGARGRYGTLGLEQAARLYDRAGFAVMRARGAGVIGLGVQTDALRGGPVDRPGALGPWLHLGAGGALDGAGSADTSLRVTTLHDRDAGDATLAVQRGELELAGRPGPLGASVALHERLDAAGTGRAGGLAAFGAGRARVELPLVRAWGGRDPLQHVVAPFIEAGGGAVASRDQAFAEPQPIADGGFASAVGGVRSSFGRWSSHAGASATVAGGLVGKPASAEPALEARVGATAAFAALRSQVAWLARRRDALVVGAHARAGREDGLHLGGYVDGRLAVEPVAARWLDADAFDAPRVGWFDRRGWTVGGELAVPWTDWLVSAAGVDYDVTARELLAVRGFARLPPPLRLSRAAGDGRASARSRGCGRLGDAGSRAVTLASRGICAVAPATAIG